jgi:hypothetical protein
MFLSTLARKFGTSSAV